LKLHCCTVLTKLCPRVEGKEIPEVLQYSRPAVVLSLVAVLLQESSFPPYNCTYNCISSPVRVLVHLPAKLASVSLTSKHPGHHRPFTKHPGPSLNIILSRS